MMMNGIVEKGHTATWQTPHSSHYIADSCCKHAHTGDSCLSTLYVMQLVYAYPTCVFIIISFTSLIDLTHILML